MVGRLILILADYPISPYCKSRIVPNEIKHISNELSSTKPLKWVIAQQYSLKWSRFSNFLVLRSPIYIVSQSYSYLVCKPYIEVTWFGKIRENKILIVRRLNVKVAQTVVISARIINKSLSAKEAQLCWRSDFSLTSARGAPWVGNGTLLHSCFLICHCMHCHKFNSMFCVFPWWIFMYIVRFWVISLLLPNPLCAILPEAEFRRVWISTVYS